MMSNNNISLRELEKLKNEEDILAFLDTYTKDDLIKLLLQIKEKRAIAWEDRAILQMIDKSPLTLWASNKSYNVVLWSETCKKIYNRDLKDRPFYEAMSIYERTQAMKDSISVIEADDNSLAQLLADFENYYTCDLNGKQSSTFSLVTNSMQLVDDETGEKYYAEIGLPIDLKASLQDYEKRQKEFEKRVEKFIESVNHLRENLTNQIDAMSMTINQSKALNASQKKELNVKVLKTRKELEANLDKSKNAFDFDTFILDNETSINSALEKLEQEMNNMINKLTSSTKKEEKNEDSRKLINDIDHCIERVNLAFNDKIKTGCTAPVNSTLNNERTAKIKELQEKRDSIIQKLQEMKEYIVQKPEGKLIDYRKYLNDVDDIINNLTHS